MPVQRKVQIKITAKCLGTRSQDEWDGADTTINPETQLKSEGNRWRGGTVSWCGKKALSLNPRWDRGCGLSV